MKEEQVYEAAKEWASKYLDLLPGQEVDDVAMVFSAGFHSRDEEVKEWIESKGKLRRRLMHIIHDLRHPWIDVKDELPFEGQSVLVKMDNGNHATCNYTHDEFVFSLILEADKININTTIKLNNVIQWMEIPN